MSVVDSLMLEGMLEVALTVAEGALRRTESRGSHHRSDHPARDDESWLRHTLTFPSAEGPLFVDKPVSVTLWQPEERVY